MAALVDREPRWLKDRNIKLYENTETIPPCDWSTVELKAFKKSFVDVPAYTTASREYTEESLRVYYNEAEVKTFAKVIPYKPPMVTYEQTPFPPAFHDELKRQGFDKPHTLFAIAWAHILSGQNFCGVAQNGPWCLAYILPCLIHVNDQLKKAKSESFGPIAVVVTNSPMRAQQLLKHFNKFSSLLNITTHIISGEKNEVEDDPQVIGLQKNPNVVIAVVGSKFTGLIVEKKLNLKQCTFLVFDDATLLHNFARSVENVLGQVRRDRQIIMWNTYFGSSICNAQEVIRRAKRYQFNHHLRFYFGAYQHFYNPKTIKHVVDFNVPDRQRNLHFILTVQTILTASAATANQPQILVFCNTNLKKVYEVLKDMDISCRVFLTTNPVPATVKGDDENLTAGKATNLEPTTSEEQLKINKQKFRESKMHQIWIATDAIPLIELDFSVFDCIVNFDFPVRQEMYDERAEKFQTEAGQGTIYTFLRLRKDFTVVNYMSDYLISHNQYCPSQLALDKSEKERQRLAEIKDYLIGKYGTPRKPLKNANVTTDIVDKPCSNRAESRLGRPYSRGAIGRRNSGTKPSNFKDDDDDRFFNRRSQNQDNYNDDFGGSGRPFHRADSSDDGGINHYGGNNSDRFDSTSPDNTQYDDDDRFYNCRARQDSFSVEHSEFMDNYQSSNRSDEPFSRNYSSGEDVAARRRRTRKRSFGSASPDNFQDSGNDRFYNRLSPRQFYSNDDIGGNLSGNQKASSNFFQRQSYSEDERYASHVHSPDNNLHHHGEDRFFNHRSLGQDFGGIPQKDVEKMQRSIDEFYSRPNPGDEGGTNNQKRRNTSRFGSVSPDKFNDDGDDGFYNRRSQSPSSVNEYVGGNFSGNQQTDVFHRQSYSGDEDDAGGRYSVRFSTDKNLQYCDDDRFYNRRTPRQGGENQQEVTDNPYFSGGSGDRNHRRRVIGRLGSSSPGHFQDCLGDEVYNRRSPRQGNRNVEYIGSNFGGNQLIELMDDTSPNRMPNHLQRPRRSDGGDERYSDYFDSALTSSEGIGGAGLSRRRNSSCFIPPSSGHLQDNDFGGFNNRQFPRQDEFNDNCGGTFEENQQIKVMENPRSHRASIVLKKHNRSDGPYSHAGDSDRRNRNRSSGDSPVNLKNRVVDGSYNRHSTKHRNLNDEFDGRNSFRQHRPRKTDRGRRR